MKKTISSILTQWETWTPHYSITWETRSSFNLRSLLKFRARSRSSNTSLTERTKIWRNPTCKRTRCSTCMSRRLRSSSTTSGITNSFLNKTSITTARKWSVPSKWARRRSLKLLRNMKNKSRWSRVSITSLLKSKRSIYRIWRKTLSCDLSRWN